MLFIDNRNALFCNVCANMHASVVHVCCRQDDVLQAKCTRMAAVAAEADGRELDEKTSLSPHTAPLSVPTKPARQRGEGVEVLSLRPCEQIVFPGKMTFNFSACSHVKCQFSLAVPHYIGGI